MKKFYNLGAGVILELHFHFAFGRKVSSDAATFVEHVTVTNSRFNSNRCPFYVSWKK